MNDYLKLCANLIKGTSEPTWVLTDKRAIAEYFNSLKNNHGFVFYMCHLCSNFDVAHSHVICNIVFETKEDLLKYIEPLIEIVDGKKAITVLGSTYVKAVAYDISKNTCENIIYS